MPPAFTSPASSANSLWNGTRTLGAAMPLPAFGVDSSVMNPIYALTTWDPFGGDTGSGGAVENQPHGFVHVHVGGDMGSFGSAGQDPIFYAHHCNVDRVWAHWRDALSRPQPPPGYFGSTVWTFYDENKKWTSIRPSDVLNHEAQLRYRYTGGLVLPSPFPHITLGPFRTPFPRITAPVVGPWPPFKIPGPDPIAQVSTEQRTRILSAVQAGQRVAVAFQNINVPQGVTGIINIVDSNGQRVGYVAIVPDTPDGKTMHAARVTAVVEVTKTAERVFAANAAPQLRLAPSERTNGPTFKSIPLRATAAHIVAF